MEPMHTYYSFSFNLILARAFFKKSKREEKGSKRWNVHSPQSSAMIRCITRNHNKYFELVADGTSRELDEISNDHGGDYLNRKRRITLFTPEKEVICSREPDWTCKNGGAHGSTATGPLLSLNCYSKRYKELSIFIYFYSSIMLNTWTNFNSYLWFSKSSISFILHF